MSFIEFKNVNKIYRAGESKIYASNNLNLKINRGGLIMIVGHSGSGKTTLLNMLGGMDRPDSGQIFFDGQEITKFSNKQLAYHRAHNVGFVFQFYNLMQNLTTTENIRLASDAVRLKKDPHEIIAKIGLENYADSFPTQMSGGQQQRVAIGRALIKEPKLILCDEPTGALDFKTSKQILKLLIDIANSGQTVIIITHNMVLCDLANQTIILREGQVVSQNFNENPADIDLLAW